MSAADAYRTLYARAPIPMVTVRDDGQVVDANPAFCEAARASRDELVGASFVDPLSAQDRGTSRVFLRRALERGTADWSVSLTGAPNVRWRVVAAAFMGQVAVLMLWTPPSQDVARTLVPALAFLARRVPEQAVVLLSPDLWVLGAWGMAEVGAGDDDGAVGRHLRSLVDAEPGLLEELTAALDDEEPWNGRLALSTEAFGGDVCRGDLVPARVVGGSRQGAGFLVLRRADEGGGPIPDRNRLHRLARVGDFSVELVDALRDRVRALARAEPGSADADRIRLEFEALDQRLGQFTDVARVEGQVSTLDVAEGLRRRWLGFLSDQGVQFEVRVDETAEGVTLAVPEDTAAVVLDELVENARVALTDTDDGWIRVTIGRTDGALTLAVQDSGPGVPRSRREAIFRPFASGRPGRLGLGLAAARAQLQLVGGSLALDDPETGARFVVRVPLEGGSRRSSGSADGRRSPLLADRSVLVVDESEEARRALVRILDTLGMTVREAWSVRSAVADLVQRGATDAVVCTVGSDEHGGARFVSELREVAPDLVGRSVVLVDVGSPARVGALEQRWGCGVLARPLVVQHLVERLEDAVAAGS